MDEIPGRNIDPGHDRAPRAASLLGRSFSRRRVLKIGGSLAGLAAASALLAACGGDDDDDGGATATTGGGAATATSGGGAATATSGGGAATATTGGAGATATTGGTTGEGAAVMVNEAEPPDAVSGELTVALAFDPTNLDPVITYTLNNGRWQENVFSGLVWRDPNLVVYDGKDGRPAPSEGFGLAESWEYTDDLTLVFKLRQGITFHNGEPFNAEAVKAHFEHLLDPSISAAQTFNYTAIKEVQATDEHTATFIFNEVDPVMVSKLAGYGGFINAPAAVAAGGDYGTKVAYGTGPYKITEFVANDHITLEAWEDYWGPRKPHIQKITYRVIPDDNTRLSEFLAGSVDVLTMSAAQADAAKGTNGVKVYDIGVPTVSGFRLDTKKAPTDNVKVRQAIAHAIDLQTIIETIFEGYAKPVAIWQSPFSFGYQDMPPYEFDVDKAKSLLQEAGVTTPVKITYDLIGGDTAAKERADAIKDMLDAAGFEVEIVEKPSSSYYQDYIDGKGSNIVDFGWGGWTLDYDNTYYSMMYTGQTYNPSYSNPEADKLLDEERGTLDQSKRLDIAHQLNKIFFDDALDVALYQNIYLWGINDRVQNFAIPPDERLFWLDAWIK